MSCAGLRSVLGKAACWCSLVCNVLGACRGFFLARWWLSCCCCLFSCLGSVAILVFGFEMVYWRYLASKYLFFFLEV